MSQLIPSSCGIFLNNYKPMNGILIDVLDVPIDYSVPSEYSTYKESLQYLEDLRNILNKKTAISWMEVLE